MGNITGKRKRRPGGHGGIHFRKRANLWVGSVPLPHAPGEKTPYRYATSMMYCKMQVKLLALREEVGVPPAHAQKLQRPLTTIEVSRQKGTHTRDEWVQLLRSVQGICYYCGELALPACEDHKIPVALGGSDAINNIAVSCEPCNQAKGALTADEFLMRGGRQRIA